MRVSQIQNLTWAGNVLVLGGLVWVGMQFVAVNKEKKQTKEWTWEKVKTSDTGPRWPGELSAFSVIWTTQVNGKVPLPPKAVDKEPPKLDRSQEFVAKLTYLTGWEFLLHPEMSMARVSYAGKETTLVPGYSLDGFQLRQFTIDPQKHTGRLVFRHPDGKPDLVVEQPPKQTPPLGSDPAIAPFKRGESDLVKDGIVSKTDVPKKAFQNDKGEWVITDHEQAWIAEWGETDIWAKLATKPDTDAQGVSHGLRLLSFPETGTGLAPSHGIGQGDVIRSINGVAIASKEDIANYLRGDGKGLERYEVVVDTNGAQRTVVYSVPRRRGAVRD